MRVKFSREQDAKAYSEAMERLYPAYKLEPYKRPYQRLWRVMVRCRVTGSILLTEAQT